MSGLAQRVVAHPGPESVPLKPLARLLANRLLDQILEGNTEAVISYLNKTALPELPRRSLPSAYWHMVLWGFLYFAAGALGACGSTRLSGGNSTVCACTPGVTHGANAAASAARCQSRRDQVGLRRGVMGMARGVLSGAVWHVNRAHRG